MKDDMAIHAGIPEKAVKAVLEEFRSDPGSSGVTLDIGKARSGRPIKLQLEAESSAEIQAAKKRVEQLLETRGFNLYP